MFPADVVVSTVEAPLQLREESFGHVGSYVASDILPATVGHGFMPKEPAPKGNIAGVLVGVEQAYSRIAGFLDGLLQRGSCHGGHHPGGQPVGTGRDRRETAASAMCSVSALLKGEVDASAVTAGGPSVNRLRLAHRAMIQSRVML